MSKKSRQRYMAKLNSRAPTDKPLDRTIAAQPSTIPDSETEPDWSGKCEVCGQSPIVPVTGMCGPCTWGESETAGGNW